MTVFNVASTGQLDAALKQAQGGDTVLMAGGVYERIILAPSKGDFAFSSKVTIAAANPADRPIINELNVTRASNIEFRNVKFEWNPQETAGGPVYLQMSDKITLDGVSFEGGLGNGYGTGVGLRLRDVTSVMVTNSEFKQLRTAANVQKAEDVRFVDNDFRRLSEDGIQLGGVKGAVVTGNDFRDFWSDPDTKHKDSIQVMSGGGLGVSENLWIKNNTFINPEQSHAIFMGNEVARDGDLGAYYRNITVENNYFETAHKLAFGVEHGYNVLVRDNTIKQNFDIYDDGKMVNIPIVNASTSSLYVKIIGNTVASVPDASNVTWEVTGNTTGNRNILHWDSSTIGPATPQAIADTPAPTVVGAPTPPPFDDGGGGGSNPPPNPDPPDDNPIPGLPTGNFGGNGIAEEFRFNGSLAAQNAQVYTPGFSFEEGDVLVLKNWEAGTFQMEPGGNPVQIFDNTRSVTIDSVPDIYEIAENSPGVTATVSTGHVVLDVSQQSGTARIVMLGLADEYLDAAPPPPPVQEPGGDGVAEEFRFNGSLAAQNAEVFAGGFSFAEGDKMVLKNWEAGVFQMKPGGNAVQIFDSTRSVTIDSALDLHEIAAHSPGFSAEVSGQGVVVEISQASGTARIVIPGLADEFEAAYAPELF